MTTPNGAASQGPPSSLALTLPTGSFEVRATHRTTGQVHVQRVGQPHAILGRAQQAAIRLDDPSVSQCHAYLQMVDDVPYCIDLGSRAGVLWSDGSQGRGWVHPGQAVRIGMFDVQISGTAPPPVGEPEPAGAPREMPPATLDVHSPGGPSGAFALDLPVTLVGRHPVCNLRLLDEAVPYFQCALVKTREGIRCVDILSRGGTVVNGRATRIAQLHDGDLIEIGKISLLLRVGSAAPPPLAIFGPKLIRPVSPAEPASSIVAPLREMMEQFQQCFVTMAQMVTAMQQENTAMMCEQMRLMQEVLREVRDSRSAPAPASPTPPAPAPPAPPAPGLTASKPVPKPVTPEEARAFADAHTWLLDRLAQKAPPTGQPKPD